jgi:hypothetical protein
MVCRHFCQGIFGQIKANACKRGAKIYKVQVVQGRFVHFDFHGEDERKVKKMFRDNINQGE